MGFHHKELEFTPHKYLQNTLVPCISACSKIWTHVVLFFYSFFFPPMEGVSAAATRSLSVSLVTNHFEFFIGGFLVLRQTHRSAFVLRWERLGPGFVLLSPEKALHFVFFQKNYYGNNNKKESNSWGGWSSFFFYLLGRFSFSHPRFRFWHLI